jgi:hypothetical protein
VLSRRNRAEHTDFPNGAAKSKLESENRTTNSRETRHDLDVAYIFTVRHSGAVSEETGHVHIPNHVTFSSVEKSGAARASARVHAAPSYLFARISLETREAALEGGCALQETRESQVLECGRARPARSALA